MRWVEVLNEAVAWKATDAAMAAIRPRIGLLRRVFASLHLAVPLDREANAALAQWLAAVTLHSELDGSGRPRLVSACAAGEWLGDREAALTSSLVQLLAESSGGTPAVQRCHGIVRAPEALGGYPPDLEVHFARRAQLTGIVDGVGLWQCPMLVRGERGARFCSKACSNASFAARKARSEPRYFAAKQERYRSRHQRGPAARVDRGAFVYID